MDKSAFRKPFRKLFSSPQKPALETAPPRADYKDAEVQYHLGLKFASGEGAALDYAQAVEWYRKAAEQNHFLAQCNLGMMYAHGQGVARDTVQSRMWLGKAAQQGDAGAQFHLGNNCHRASFRQMPAASRFAASASSPRPRPGRIAPRPFRLFAKLGRKASLCVAASLR